MWYTTCSTEIANIWPDIHDKHRNVAFAIVIIAINKIPSLIPYSRNIRFRIQNCGASIQ